MARPFIPVENVLKAEVRYLYLNQRMENVLYFHTSVAPGFADASALGAQIKSWFNASMKQQVTHQLQLSEIVFTSMVSATGFRMVYTEGLPVSGTNPSGGLPGNVTLAVRLNTNLRGRSYTGRLYHIGLPADVIVDGELAAAHPADLKGVYDTLLATTSLDGREWVVVSFVHGKALRTTGVATSVSSITIDPNIDSQRRRLVGRGR